MKTSLEAENLTEENKAISRIPTDIKAFYSYANKHQKINGGLGPLKVNNQLITSPPDICESISDQFLSVYSTPDPNHKIEDPSVFFDLGDNTLPSLLDIDFTEDMIEKAIDTLKANLAAAILLKSYKKELRKP